MIRFFGRVCGDCVIGHNCVSVFYETFFLSLSQKNEVVHEVWSKIKSCHYTVWSFGWGVVLVIINDHGWYNHLVES